MAHEANRTDCVQFRIFSVARYHSRDAQLEGARVVAFKATPQPMRRLPNPLKIEPQPGRYFLLTGTDPATDPAAMLDVLRRAFNGGGDGGEPR